MIRVSRFSIPALLALLLFQQALWAEEGSDAEFAQIMPLAADSMLLDVTRTPNGFVAVGERGHVVFSADGIEWQQAESVPTRATLTSVFSYGDRLWAGGHDAALISSVDGGRNWTLQYFDPDRQQAVMDIRFSNETDGIAIGSYGLALYTSDGGDYWEDGIIDEENEYHLNRFIDFGDERQMIAGEAGYSYRSFDDGQTWEQMDLPYLGSMWGGIRRPDGCVLFFGLRGNILESCDFGDSWEELQTDSEASLSAAAQYDGKVVFAGNSGVILIRDEDGSFNVHHHSSGVDFASVISMDDGRFMLVGEDGVHWYPEEAGERDGE